MYTTKTVVLSLLLAYAEARFGQEQIPVSAIQALSNFGNPGEAATLAGQVPSALLAGTNACDKLSLADQIVTTLGNDPQVISAAQALVGAEKNTNPFAVSIPSICSDTNLPATSELRGIVPLIDPATVGADVQNANAATSLKTPFNANGLSVADVSIAQGFSNFTLQGSNGATSAAGGAGTGATTGGAAGNNNAGNTNAGTTTGTGNAVQCGGATTAPANNATTGGATTNNGATGGAAGDGLTTSSIAGLDFGLCVPTMDFIGGRPGRKATEFTFAPTDPSLKARQPEALNGGIIINFLCDALTNFCDANQAAKDKCQQAQDFFGPSPDKSATTAQSFNAMLGFENVAFQ